MSQTSQSTAQNAELKSDAARIARIMGLSNWKTMTELALVNQIERGLPLKAVENVAHVIGQDDKKMKFEILSRSTYSRIQNRKNKQLSKDISEKLHGITRVIDQAMQLWNSDRDAVTRFLYRPHPMLTGRTPLDVAKQSTVGADLVVKIIGEARAGVAA